MSRFATFDSASHVIRPRFDPIGPRRRLDYNQPAPLLATLEGRTVFLARPDPRSRPPGEPYPLTVPLTVSRMRRAYDIERGYAVGPYEPSLVTDVPLSTPFGQAPVPPTGTAIRGGLYALAGGALFGAAAGALLGDTTWWQGAKVGALATAGAYGVLLYQATA